MKAIFKLMGVVFLLTVMLSCQFDNEVSDDVYFKQVSISINEPGQANSFSGSPPRSDAVVSSSTSVILAIPTSITVLDQNTDLTNIFDRQLLDTTDNTVSLLVPLDTEMKLIKVNYSGAITLAVFDEQNTPPIATGLSDIFTISGGTTEKAITIAMTSSIAFEISSTSPADGATDVPVDTAISIIFSVPMATSGISTTTSGTLCDSHIKVSSDNFSTCVEMTAQPAYSNSNMTLTVTPSSNLATNTTYKIQTSTDIQNASGVERGAEYTSSTGFTTAATSTTLIGGTVQGQDLSLAGDVIFFSGDGTAAVADGTGIEPGTSFYGPYGLTTNGTKLWVTEYYNHVIREIVIGSGTTSGAVTTVAGTGALGTGDPASDDGFGITDAQFSYPAAITTDGANLLWVADSDAHLIRQIDMSNSYEVTTLAGGLLTGGDETLCTGGNSANCYDGTGQYARFNFPYGIVYYNGYLYVADRNNCRIRRINVSTAYVETWSGEGTCGYNTGLASTAQFDWPTSITTDGSLFLYVADMNNNVVHRVGLSTGFVETIAGDVGTPTNLDAPRGVTTDGTNLYMSETGATTNRIMTSLNSTVTAAPSSVAGGASADPCAAGSSAVARFKTPKGMASDGTYLYVASQACGIIFRIE